MNLAMGVVGCVSAGAVLALGAVLTDWWSPSVTTLICLGLVAAQVVALAVPYCRPREPAVGEVPLRAEGGGQPRA
jgi:CHASE2 domain-containing sensor protein